MSYVESSLWDVEDFCRLKIKELRRNAVCKNIIHDTPGSPCTNQCKIILNVKLRTHVRTLWLLMERTPNNQDIFIGWKDDILTPMSKTKATKKINVPWCSVCGLKGKKDLHHCKGCSASYHELCKLKISSSGDNAIADVCSQCKANCRIKCGQVVWHKMKHSVWWPALLLPASERPDFLPRRPSESHEAVMFYGEGKYAWADPRHTCTFNPNHYLKTASNGNRKLSMAFREAVQAYEDLNKSNNA